MCETIFDAHCGQVASIGQLRALTGIEPYWQGGYDLPIRDELCLCPVDIPSTLLAAWFKVWKEKDGDPWVYFCERLD